MEKVKIEITDKPQEYRIVAVSSREVIWKGLALNPRHARRQAAALLGRSRIGLPGYVTLGKNHDFIWNGVDIPLVGMI